METVTLILVENQAKALKEILQTEEDSLLLEFKDYEEGSDFKSIKIRVKHEYQLLYIGMKLGHKLSNRYE